MSARLSKMAIMGKVTYRPFIIIYLKVSKNDANSFSLMKSLSTFHSGGAFLTVGAHLGGKPTFRYVLKFDMLYLGTIEPI